MRAFVFSSHKSTTQSASSCFHRHVFIYAKQLGFLFHHLEIIIVVLSCHQLMTQRYPVVRYSFSQQFEWNPSTIEDKPLIQTKVEIRCWFKTSKLRDYRNDHHLRRFPAFDNLWWNYAYYCKAGYWVTSLTYFKTNLWLVINEIVN